MTHKNRLLAVIMLACPLWLTTAVDAADPPAGSTTSHDAGHGDDHAAPNPIESGTLTNAIATLITFGILLVILGTLVWPRVLAQLKNRENFIRDSLSSAKTQREEAEHMLSGYKQQLEEARHEATKIVEEGRRDAEVTRREIMDEARQEADATMKRAKREIEIARDTAVKDLYGMAGDLATDIAGKILNKELDASAHDRLIQDAISQIGNDASRN